MSSRTTTRAAALGTTAALAASMLVGATAGSASAGGGTTTYDCAFPAPLGTLPVPVATEVPDLPSVPAGAPIPAGSLDPAFVVDAVGLTGVLGLVSGLSASGMALGVGEQSVPLDGFSFGQLDGTDLPGSASSRAFDAPATPGSYPVTAPESFDITGMLGLTELSIPCATDAPALLGTLTVLPADGTAVIPSTTEAKLKKKRIRRGKRAKVIVTSIAGVDPLVMPAAGEVVVRKGKRKVGTGTLDEDGRVVIRTKRFKKRGRFTLKVKYLGDTLTSPSTDKVRVRVVKKRRRR